MATDVAQEGLDMPSCNFVIRYNFVSNEIGSVQSKGRARARDSECYLIVERGSSSERKELENLRKEEVMMAALLTFDQIPHNELRQKIAYQQVGYEFCVMCTVASLGDGRGWTIPGDTRMKEYWSNDVGSLWEL